MPSAAHDAGPDVDHRGSDPHARPVGLARDADEARERLHQRVVTGAARERPGRAECLDRAVDEPGSRARSSSLPRPCRSAEPARIDWTTTSAPSISRSSASLPALVGEVERERALRAVRGEEHDAAAREELRPPLPRLVAAPRMLDLHDLGAEPSEDLRAGWPGERRGQVDDANPLQRLKAHAPEATHRIASEDAYGELRNGAR